MIPYNPKGLTAQEVEKSRREHGDNIITPPKDDSAWKLLLEKFRSKEKKKELKHCLNTILLWHMCDVRTV